MSVKQQRPAADDEDSYFVSTTDLMVGLLFVFLILLMYFALQLDSASRKAGRTFAEAQQSSKSLQQEIDRLSNIEEARREILLELEQILKSQGIAVSVVLEQGILRFPESILFETYEATLTNEGEDAVEHLAGALESVLPCYTFGPFIESKCQQARLANVEAIYIEGHTDSDPIDPNATIKDNLELSAIRATNTFREAMNKSEIRNGAPMLRQFLSPDRFPVLSFSGYGEHRPVVFNPKSDYEKSLNRRIDLRILMATPDSSNVQEFRDRLWKEVQGD